MIASGKSKNIKGASVLVMDKIGIKIPTSMAKNNIIKVKRVLLTLSIMILKRLNIAQNATVTSKAAESTRNTLLKAEKSKLIWGNNLCKNFNSL